MNIFHSYFAPPKPSFIACSTIKHRMSDSDYRVSDEPKERTNSHESNEKRSEWMRNNHIRRYVEAFNQAGGEAYASEIAEILNVKPTSVARFLAGNENVLFRRIGNENNAVIWELIC